MTPSKDSRILYKQTAKLDQQFCAPSCHNSSFWMNTLIPFSRLY